MTHHAKPSAAAPPAVPFKGESFPPYVLQRVPTRASSGSCCSTLQLQDGPPMGSVATAKSAFTLERANPSSSSSSRLLQAAASPSALLIATRSRTPQLTSPAPFGSPSARTRSFQRPSLSDQLKSISQGAQDITSQLKTAYKLQHGAAVSTSASFSTEIEFQATTIGMSVGKLECRFPCPVHFMGDHCSYLFQHPFEAKEIHMVMYYRDMTQVHVSLHDKTFQFRINHALEQFGEDYKPSNPQHVIRIVLATVSEAQRVKQFVAEHRHWFAS